MTRKFWLGRDVDIQNKYDWIPVYAIEIVDHDITTCLKEEQKPLNTQNVIVQMSRDMRFPTMWYVRPPKAQTSLRIRAAWSEPLLVAWIFYDC